jgi:hypothetical protein
MHDNKWLIFRIIKRNAIMNVHGMKQVKEEVAKKH